MLDTIYAYHQAMCFANAKYGRAHWSNVCDEWHEFIMDRNVGELCDVLHTLIRITGSTWLGIVVWPCAVKFAARYVEYGDIRSKRNLEG